MSRIEQLIAELCPDGVEYKELGELCSVETGKQLNRTKLSDKGKYPVLNGGAEYSGFYDEYNTKEKTIAISQGGASAGFVNYMFSKFWAGAHCYVVNPTNNVIINKFLFYILKNGQIKLQNAKQGAGIPGLKRSELKKFPIPIPPLPIQQEIVRILDTFTDLDAELQAELEARKKQYEHYRNQLLNFEGKEVEWKTLGEVMNITRGASPRPINNFITNNKDGVPWIKIGDVNPQNKFITQTKEKITKEGAQKSRFLKKGDFVLSNSMSFGRPYILKVDGCIHDGWISMQNFENVLISDFLYYLLSSDIAQKYWKQKASSGTVQNLNADIVRATKIPIPHLSEQERIIGILDRFDKLVNEELPAEIAARRKQYEHYREKLLTFKKAE